MDAIQSQIKPLLQLWNYKLTKCSSSLAQFLKWQNAQSTATEPAFPHLSQQFVLGDQTSRVSLHGKRATAFKSFRRDSTNCGESLPPTPVARSYLDFQSLVSFGDACFYSDDKFRESLLVDFASLEPGATRWRFFTLKYSRFSSCSNSEVTQLRSIIIEILLLDKEKNGLEWDGHCQRWTTELALNYSPIVICFWFQCFLNLEYSDLQRIKRELTLLQKLYSLYNNVIENVNSYYDILWAELDIDKINSELLEFQNK